jgi:hypothetical protein
MLQWDPRSGCRPLVETSLAASPVSSMSSGIGVEHKQAHEKEMSDYWHLKRGPCMLQYFLQVYFRGNKMPLVCPSGDNSR